MLHRFEMSLEDLPVESIEEALAAAPTTTSLETLLAVQHFVNRIGGLENARLAIRMLRDLEDAA